MPEVLALSSPPSRRALFPFPCASHSDRFLFFGALVQRPFCICDFRDLTTMAALDLQVVRVYKELVDRLLKRAAEVKADSQIEPPLTEGILGESIWKLSAEDDEAVSHFNSQTRFAAVEIAFREKFYRILVSSPSIFPGCEFIMVARR